MFTQDGYVKLMLTVIAASLFALTVERISRGAPPEFSACGWTKLNPCHVIVDEIMAPPGGSKALKWFKPD